MLRRGAVHTHANDAAAYRAGLGIESRKKSEDAFEGGAIAEVAVVAATEAKPGLGCTGREPLEAPYLRDRVRGWIGA